jgi:hypothetical protein
MRIFSCALIYGFIVLALSFCAHKTFDAIHIIDNNPFHFIIRVMVYVLIYYKSYDFAFPYIKTAE